MEIYKPRHILEEGIFLFPFELFLVSETKIIILFVIFPSLPPISHITLPSQFHDLFYFILYACLCEYMHEYVHDKDNFVSLFSVVCMCMISSLTSLYWIAN